MSCDECCKKSLVTIEMCCGKKSTRAKEGRCRLRNFCKKYIITRDYFYAEVTNPFRTANLQPDSL